MKSVYRPLAIGVLLVSLIGLTGVAQSDDERSTDQPDAGRQTDNAASSNREDAREAAEQPRHWHFFDANMAETFRLPAQRAEEAPDRQPQEAADVLQGVYSIEALIARVGVEQNASFLYDPAMLRNRTISIVDPIATPATRAGWFRLLGGLLEYAGFTYGRMLIDEGGAPVYRVVQMTMMSTVDTSIVTNPADMPEDEYVGTLIVHPQFVDAASMQRNLLNFISRPGGMVQPVMGSNGLAIKDTRPKLDYVFRMIQALDRAPHAAGEPAGEEVAERAAEPVRAERPAPPPSPALGAPRRFVPEHREAEELVRHASHLFPEFSGWDARDFPTAGRMTPLPPNAEHPRGSIVLREAVHAEGQLARLLEALDQQSATPTRIGDDAFIVYKARTVSAPRLPNLLSQTMPELIPRVMVAAERVRWGHYVAHHRSVQPDDGHFYVRLPWDRHEQLMHVLDAIDRENVERTDLGDGTILIPYRAEFLKESRTGHSFVHSVSQLLHGELRLSEKHTLTYDSQAGHVLIRIGAEHTDLVDQVIQSLGEWPADAD